MLELGADSAFPQCLRAVVAVPACGGHHAGRCEREELQPPSTALTSGPSWARCALSPVWLLIQRELTRSRWENLRQQVSSSGCGYRWRDGVEWALPLCAWSLVMWKLAEDAAGFRVSPASASGEGHAAHRCILIALSLLSSCVSSVRCALSFG